MAKLSIEKIKSAENEAAELRIKADAEAVNIVANAKAQGNDSYEREKRLSMEKIQNINTELDKEAEAKLKKSAEEAESNAESFKAKAEMKIPEALELIIGGLKG